MPNYLSFLDATKILKEEYVYDKTEHLRLLASFNSIQLELYIRAYAKTQSVNLEIETIPFGTLRQSIISNIDEGKNIIESIQRLYEEIKGMTSIAVMTSDSNKLILATNNGSLYYVQDKKHKGLVFASERHIINSLIKKQLNTTFEIQKIKPWTQDLYF